MPKSTNGENPSSDHLEIKTNIDYSATILKNSASVSVEDLDNAQKRFVWPLKVRRIKDESMYPAYEAGQWVLISTSSSFELGDTVLFLASDHEQFGRVAGIEGEHLYLLGDNPNFCTDSRQFGYVRRDTVVGRIIFPSTK